ncbi:hypothetical protein P2318_28005 [Myxococcaceae bacterium GXIMD 01537]
MSRSLLSLLVLAALGCGTRQKTEADAAADAPAPRLERTSSDSGAQVANAAQAAAAASPVKPTPGLHGLLVPPEGAGLSRVHFDGCLAQAEASEVSGARFPAPAVTRGPSGGGVTVSPLGGGVLVVHDLAHGCCLRADVRSSLEGRTVTVTETLTGNTCRCRCRSTVKAAVSLPPGDYRLRVVTEEPGNRQVAHEAPLSVR